MKIRVLGGGVYGTHIALSLIADGHEVELHEIADRLFNGASGNGPARGHRGFHYPRSRVTQLACQDHVRQFEARYGHLTHGVRTNIYAIAAQESLIDFGAYRKVLHGDVEFLNVERPDELGLVNVEGAVLTGERHFVVDKARDWFAKELSGHVKFNQDAGAVDDPRWDVTIDATFCSNDEIGVDRFEACITVLLEGPVDRSITIMDGPLPGMYVWNEEKGLTSLTSAKYTPMARTSTWREARAYLDGLSQVDIGVRAWEMFDQMAQFYPRIRDEYRIVGQLLAVRALPKSASDARLVDVIRIGERAIRVRAGKIDAIFQAEEIIKGMIRDGRLAMKHAMAA
jgi:hypothetical protein